jgi:hypothetical protein
MRGHFLGAQGRCLVMSSRRERMPCRADVRGQRFELGRRRRGSGYALLCTRGLFACFGDRQATSRLPGGRLVLALTLSPSLTANFVICLILMMYLSCSSASFCLCSGPRLTAFAASAVNDFRTPGYWEGDVLPSCIVCLQEDPKDLARPDRCQIP